MSKSKTVTTNQIEGLVQQANRVYAARLRYDRGRAAAWRAARNGAVGGLHRIVKPAARPYAGLVLADLAGDLLAQLQVAYQELIDVEKWRQEAVTRGRQAAEEVTRLTGQVANLRQQLAQARTDLARRPAATSLVLPAQKITVESGIQREILRLLAVEGLGRVWRIVERVLDSELTGTPNTARNAVNRLAERGLLADYEQHGKPVGWAYKAGGTRRLVQLTPLGQQWCQAAFGQEPVESEIAVAARRHKSVSHGVAILEAAHLLAAAGYAVDEDPHALLADDAAPWHARAEPDLALFLEDAWWPVEVQRETSTRTLDKWRKTLEFTGRLALVLYHEEARKKQAAILTAARFRLPHGVIWLSSLERMERAAWEWQEITTTG